MDKQGSFWISLMLCVVIASSTPTIPEHLRNALDIAFQKGSEIDHVRILFFLVESIEAGTASPFMHSLETTISTPALFKRVAESLVHYIKTEDKYLTYRQSKQDVWFEFLKEVGLVKIDNGQGWEIISQEDLAFASAKYALMRTVRDWSPGTFDAVKHAVENFIIGPLGFIGDALKGRQNSIEVVRLDLVALNWDVYENIHRWWKDEISGTVCVKNIIDSCASVAGGVAGGLGGQMAGAWVGGAVGGPVGMGIGSLAGAILGALGGSHAGYVLSDMLTRWIFGLPKREAIEKAYEFLGVDATASKSDINSKYRKLSLRYHPDKGGDEADWMRLQASMVVIRKARGEP